ncbi:hypothetical protein [Leptospira santarosai]|uniref:hypothetical protein n=1 Tax=Leptospira santarosai TaxID=28183 RepID=UPI0026E2154B|nr:hypothetical protein [Leptospira santarosai]
MNFSDTLKQAIESPDYFQHDCDGDEFVMKQNDAKRQAARLRQLIEQFRPSSPKTSPLSGALRI